MKDVRKIQIGSNVFFSDYEDFEPSDNDLLTIMEPFFLNHNSMRMKIKNNDIIMYKNGLTKEDYINDALTSDLPLVSGKFLVPEFVEYIGFTIEDLHQFNDIFSQIDDAHKYEKIIYDAYIENNSFTLTDEQRNAAYEEYKKYRANK